MKKLIYI